MVMKNFDLLWHYSVVSSVGGGEDRSAGWERYLGVPDDLPTRFVAEHLDLETNGQACQLSCYHSFAVESEEARTRLYGFRLLKK